MSKGEQIEKLRTGPLSSLLLEPLLLAAEALGTLRCKIDNCNILVIASEIMFIKDLQSYYAMQ